jgi:hypothetical protein
VSFHPRQRPEGILAFILAFFFFRSRITLTRDWDDVDSVWGSEDYKELTRLPIKGKWKRGCSNSDLARSILSKFLRSLQYAPKEERRRPSVL